MISNKGDAFTELTLEVFKVGGVLSAEGDSMSAEYGLSSARWKVLGAVERSEQYLTVPEIGRYMGQSRQATQRLVGVMTDDGLLELLENPNHKRAKYVCLTEKGQDVYDKLFEKHIPWAEGGADQFSAEELNTALSVLQRISVHFAE